MIDKKTVFIIGAGGSYPYGFPLGIELRWFAYSYAETMIKNLGAELGNDFSNDTLKLAKQFSRQFRISGDQSIDWFLKKFPRYTDIGKFLILHYILQAENASKFLEDMDEKKKSQDWYWYLYNEMSKYPKGKINPSLFLNNKVTFITFNYDRSLEYFLYTCFSNGHDFEKFKITAKELFNNISFHHVYGKVARLDWEKDINYSNQAYLPYKGYRQSFNLLNSLKNNIQLIDEREANKNMKLSKEIKNAERIFFLGFSYADENLEMLDIPNVLNKDQWIYGTAFGMTENEIRKIKRKFLDKVESKKLHFEDIDCLGLLRKFL